MSSLCPGPGNLWGLYPALMSRFSTSSLCLLAFVQKENVQVSALPVGLAGLKPTAKTVVLSQSCWWVSASCPGPDCTSAAPFWGGSTAVSQCLPPPCFPMRDSATAGAEEEVCHWWVSVNRCRSVGLGRHQAANFLLFVIPER